MKTITLFCETPGCQSVATIHGDDFVPKGVWFCVKCVDDALHQQARELERREIARKSNDPKETF